MDRSATTLPAPAVEVSDRAAERLREALAEEAGAPLVRVDVGVG